MGLPITIMTWLVYMETNCALDTKDTPYVPLVEFLLCPFKKG